MLNAKKNKALGKHRFGEEEFIRFYDISKTNGKYVQNYQMIFCVPKVHFSCCGSYIYVKYVLQHFLNAFSRIAKMHYFYSLHKVYPTGEPGDLCPSSIQCTCILCILSLSYILVAILLLYSIWNVNWIIIINKNFHQTKSIDGKENKYNLCHWPDLYCLKVYPK